MKTLDEAAADLGWAINRGHECMTLTHAETGRVIFIWDDIITPESLAALSEIKDGTHAYPLDTHSNKW